MTKRKQPPIECRFVDSTAICGACSLGKEKYADAENW